MLGLPELDTIVCEQLRRQDLAQCARVSKKWHAAVIPHLWGDLKYLRNLSDLQKDAFRNMVQEDYLEEIQRLRLREDDHVMEQDVQTSSPTSSALSKYGTWIQELPSVEDLERILLPPTPTGQNDTLTADETLLHLLKRCSPDVRVASMSRFLRMDHDSDSRRGAIVDFTLPRLHHLSIQITLESPRPGLSKVMNLLGRCSVVLKKLELSFTKNFGGNVDRHGEEKQAMGEHNDWISLKELTLYNFTECAETRRFWSWVFRRCGQVEKLEVSTTIGTTQNLAQDMSMHMPNLTDITLGYSSCCGHGRMDDKKVAELLSGSRKGFKILTVRYTAYLGAMAVAALQKHSSTLESLVIEQGDGVSGGGLVQVLSTFTNLHTLCNIGRFSGLDPIVFGDRDPDTGLLKPWKCEPALKVLKVVILGIPRPDAWSDGAIEKVHLSQGRELHHLVYDRLARFTNLETLCLGGDGSWGRPDCLKMSLESGLHRLSGLKMLKELDVSSMNTRIGVEEVQWMIEHWPRLQTIRGLDENDFEKKVVGWLRANLPEIEVVR